MVNKYAKDHPHTPASAHILYKNHKSSTYVTPATSYRDTLTSPGRYYRGAGKSLARPPRRLLTKFTS